MVDRHERAKELRAEDPHGRQSNSDIELRMDIEELEQMALNLPDAGALHDVAEAIRAVVAVINSIHTRLA